MPHSAALIEKVVADLVRTLGNLHVEETKKIVVIEEVRSHSRAQWAGIVIDGGMCPNALETFCAASNLAVDRCPAVFGIFKELVEDHCVCAPEHGDWTGYEDFPNEHDGVTTYLFSDRAHFFAITLCIECGYEITHDPEWVVSPSLHWIESVEAFERFTLKKTLKPRLIEPHLDWCSLPELVAHIDQRFGIQLDIEDLRPATRWPDRDIVKERRHRPRRAAP